jgi:hypothetical protein
VEKWEASNTPTIRRLIPSCRHQLSPIAPKSFRGPELRLAITRAPTRLANSRPASESRSTRAAIAAQGRPYPGGYYYYNNGCYIRRADGAWILVDPRLCAGPPVYVAPPVAVAPPPPEYDVPPGYAPPPTGYALPPPPVAANSVAACAQRYRSYDPTTQTFLGFDGLRHPCP